MNTQHPKKSLNRSAALYALLAGLLWMTGAQANDIGISERATHNFLLPSSPLFLGVRPSPNLLFVVDDSPSMDWHVVTPLDEWGAREILFDDAGNATIAYDYPSYIPSAERYWIPSFAPPATLITLWNSMNPADISGDHTALNADGLWRLRNSDYNGLYYDPNRLYLPWSGVDSDGDAFAQADIESARWDPHDADSTVTDLTDKLAWFSAIPARDGNFYYIAAVDLNATTARVYYLIPQDGYSQYHIQDVPNGGQLQEYYVPRYYSWTDTDNDGVVDATDAHTLVEIPDSDPEQLSNFANWFQYYRSRTHTVKHMVSELIYDRNDMRAGLTTLHNDSRYRQTTAQLNIDAASGNKRVILDKLFRYTPDKGATPIHAALERAGEYFECEDSGYYETFYPHDGNPIFRANQNMFGESGAGSCPILPAAQGGQCQRNITFMIVDGFSTPDAVIAAYYTGAPPIAGLSNGYVRNYNKPFGPGVTRNTDGDNNTEFDGGAYADSYSNSVADVAMHYYERDISDNHHGRQFMETFAIKMAVEGSLTEDPPNADDSFAWPDHNAEQVDDIRHTAFNGRGIFGDTLDPTLVPRLQSIFDRFSNQHSTATNTAVTSSALLTGTAIFVAAYNTEEISGDLLKVPVNEDGTLSAPVWRAANKIDDQNWASGREIITFNPVLRQGIPFTDTALDKTAFVFGDLMFDVPQSINGILNDNKLRPHHDKLGVSNGLSKDEIEYIRGNRAKEGSKFRKRATVMGPVFNSDPVFVGPPSFDYPDGFEGADYSAFREKYKDRAEMIYVGANDGMLHAIDANTGLEKLAYVPTHIMSKLKGYPYDEWGPYSLVDGELTVIDAYLRGYDHCPTGPGDCWRSILVGGFGRGAQGYFALDITDPTLFDEANAAKLVLWEFHDSGGMLDDLENNFYEYLTKAACVNLVTACINNAAANKISKLYEDIVKELHDRNDKIGHSDLGYTFGHMNIVRLGDGKWYTVFGNGYNNTEIDLEADGLLETLERITTESDVVLPDSSALGFSLEGSAWIYITDLATGELVRAFDTRTGYFLSPEKLTQAGVSVTLDNMLNPSDAVIGALGADYIVRPNGMATPAAVDEHSEIPVGADHPASDFTTIEHIYAGDLMGSLWRLDVSANDPDDWFLRYSSGSGDSARPQPLFNASVTSGRSQPITIRPDVTSHPNKTSWIVLFGTGRYLDVADTTALLSNPTQSIYGIWDQDVDSSTPTSPPSISRSDLLERLIVKIVPEEIDTDLDGVEDTVVDLRITSADPEDPSDPDFTKGEDSGPLVWREPSGTTTGTHLGWYMDLLNPGEVDSFGERLVSRPRLRNGRILFSTITPGKNLCDGGGLSYIMQLNARTGERPRFSPFDLNADGGFNDDDKVEIADGVEVYASGRTSSVGLTGVPVIIITSDRRELHIQSGPARDVELTIGNPGAFERSRSTWRNLR